MGKGGGVGDIKKNIISLTSAELTKRVVKVEAE